MKEQMPPVTVVIPTRDRDHLLVRAVASIAAQRDAGPLEVLVVRDHTAPTPLDVDLPPNVTLRQVVNDRTQGLAGTRNTGVLAATHDLIATCDDDDEWLPHKLAAQFAAWARHPDAVLVGTGIVLVVTGDDGVVEHPRPAPDGLVSQDQLLADRIMELGSSGFLFRRRDLLDRIGLVDETLPAGYAEDYDLILRAVAVGPVLSVAEPLVRIHWHGSSYYASRWQTIHDALDGLLGKHPEFARSPRGTARIVGQQALALAALGRRGPALRAAGRALRLAPAEKRAYLAVAVAGGVVDVERLRQYLHRRGRGL